MRSSVEWRHPISPCKTRIGLIGARRMVDQGSQVNAMTTAIKNPPSAIDADVLTLAIYDFLTAKKRPVTIDQVELRIYGLSGDWLSRKLVDEFRKRGTFPLVERYLARWRNVLRTSQRRQLEELVESGARRGLWQKSDGPRGEVIGVGAASASSLSALIREFASVKATSAPTKASDRERSSPSAPSLQAR